MESLVSNSKYFTFNPGASGGLQGNRCNMTDLGRKSNNTQAAVFCIRWSGA